MSRLGTRLAPARPFALTVPSPPVDRQGCLAETIKPMRAMRAPRSPYRPTQLAPSDALARRSLRALQRLGGPHLCMIVKDAPGIDSVAEYGIKVLTRARIDRGSPCTVPSQPKQSRSTRVSLLPANRHAARLTWRSPAMRAGLSRRTKCSDPHAQLPRAPPRVSDPLDPDCRMFRAGNPIRLLEVYADASIRPTQQMHCRTAASTRPSIANVFSKEQR